MSSTANSNPPPCVRVVYDETYRGKSIEEPSILSMAQIPHLIGYLEHHSSDTDGSFGICVAGGNGIFVSKVFTLNTQAIILIIYV